MDICNCLSYKEIEKLVNEFGYSVNSSENLFYYLAEKRELIFDKMETKLHYTFNSAKISLSTPDYIAYLVGRYIHLKEEMAANVFFTNQFIRPINYLTSLINKAISLLTDEIEMNQMPTYGISYFFTHKRENAEIKFETYLNTYRNYLETIDYEKVINLFFDRLGLDFIPCLKNKELNELSNRALSKMYISKFEIFQLFSSKNFKNVDDFRVEKENLLTVNDAEKNITKYNFEYENVNLFKMTLILFFEEHYEVKSELDEDIDVFFTCLTQPNPKAFHSNKNTILNARTRLRYAIKNHSMEFLDLIYNLNFIFKTSQKKLAYLISVFFELEGMKKDTCHDHLRGKRIKADYLIKNKKIKNFVENADWTLLK